jgi:hypothetical protein
MKTSTVGSSSGGSCGARRRLIGDAITKRLIARKTTQNISAAYTIAPGTKFCSSAGDGSVLVVRQ